MVELWRRLCPEDGRQLGLKQLAGGCANFAVAGGRPLGVGGVREISHEPGKTYQVTGAQRLGRGLLALMPLPGQHSRAFL